jgi:microcystin-dependent protein
MPLNKLDNFIKNTEGRILYVNPNDLDSTDSIENQGNSLARPFKTIQRALLEAARFSYVRGSNNDLTEKTTILLFPGEHVVDNRPGWAIYANNGAKAVSRSGSESIASTVFSLGLDSNFDLNQEDNILYKFNSFYGGVVVPRGTSIVGLDLRKTKIRPKYVPNPTDSAVDKSAIFRITGACYFWQFSLFDGDSSGLVYTNPDNFGSVYTSTPNFSHHKLTCFEFCDGVNEVGNYALSDLDMYYSKVSNAYNAYREIDQKFPSDSDGFAKRNPEWEIVGAFASDPIEISTIVSGNGATATAIVTVTTATEHGLNAGTPIKIKNVGTSSEPFVDKYNISTTVQNVTSPTTFTYLLPALESYPTIDPSPTASGATVTVETDTVSGASPYIFNCSLRSVWGMNGLHADGSKASGFRSTVVAQFTAVSLQKDDRAFAKYDKSSRSYQVVPYTAVYGAALPQGASQTNSEKVYHLDSEAIYRQGWETSHIKVTNDAFIQIVSVFAIGFNKHFDAETGGDASITNSNSNFGQISLNSSGFKKEAFEKDNKAFITSIIPPRAIDETEEQIDWVSIDVGLTTSVAIAEGTTKHLYLYGYNSIDTPPSAITQGYRIGARLNDKLYFVGAGVTYSASIYMCNNKINDTGFTAASGTTSSVKSYSVTGSPSSNSFTIGSNNLLDGEKIKIISDDGDLPENIIAHETYYVIKDGSNNIKLASSFSNALTNQPITVYGGSNLTILSRVSDKGAGELGSPIQFDPQNNNWFIHVNSGNEIYNALLAGGTATYGETTDVTFVKRISDERSLDEKLYKFRVVVPKELSNAKDPEVGFILQESSSTGFVNDSESTRTSIGRTDYEYNKNPRFISTCTVSSNTITAITEKPHNLEVGDVLIIKNVKSSYNTVGAANSGYNGRFTVTGVTNANTFQYSTTDVDGRVRNPGTFSSNTNVRTTSLPRFEKNDWLGNLFVYRNEVISPYIEGQQDGIYHLYVLNANNQVQEQFTNLKFGQLPSDLYPQLDRDNANSNPPAAKTYAKRAPIGGVVTNDLKKSITRETADLTLKEIGIGLTISSVSSSTSSATITFPRFHSLSGIVTGSISVSGATYNSGTYQNVKLLNGSSSGTWNGATAKVVIDGSGAVSSVEVVCPGSGYGAGNLYFDQSTVGGDGTALYTITAAGISTNIGDVVQFTGAGTTSDTYHRITSVPSSTTISIAKTSGDPTITNAQYAFVIGPSIQVSTSNYTTSSGITTFVTTTAHGLVAGNRFRVTDSSNNNLGNYLVSDVVSVTSFTAVTNQSISAANGWILKHGMSSNEGTSDRTSENIGARQVTFYDSERFRLTSALTSGTTLNFATYTGIGTAQRLPLGSYIQIDNEIMRVASVSDGASATIIRGVFGTVQENHDVNSLIRKISPAAIEFRRPSIVRASGHTFEYLGYGPGNYSTGLPQVQVKTLSEEEQFFSQAQERSCGVVVYTGMNNNGDFFNGNTKTIAASGEIVSYDIPTPTVTGESGGKLSVVFDEVSIKERLVVEGGVSGTILSQFDGPVTFNQDVRIKAPVVMSNKVKINNTSSDALTVTGGTVLNGELVVNTGIVPDTDEGAYLGTAALPFSDAHIGEVRIAQTDDNTIDTATGSLKLNAPTGSNVAIQTTTTINGNLDLTSSPSGSGKISANYLDVPNITPIGGIVMWPGGLDSWPTDNWKLCNGQEVSRTTYSELFALVGTTYGSGDGVNTFNLPNLLERFVVGAGGNNPTVSGGTVGDSYSRGDTGGTKDSTIVSHTHTGTTVSSGRHTHSFAYSGDNDANADPNGGFMTDSNPSTNIGNGVLGTPTQNVGEQIGGARGGDVDVNGRHTHTFTTDSTGSSGVNQNLPPYIGLYFIMRVI